MQTYFIANRQRVKIGKSKDAVSRRQQLQTSSPEPLNLLLVLDGDREKEFHLRFSRDYSRGEWFTLSSDIQQFIDECQKNPRIVPPLQLPRRQLETLLPSAYDEARTALASFPNSLTPESVPSLATAICFLRKCTSSKAQRQGVHHVRYLTESWGKTHRLPSSIINETILVAAAYLGIITDRANDESRIGITNYSIEMLQRDIRRVQALKARRLA